LVADVAFDLWLSSAFRGSPEGALLTAVEMFRGTTPAKLFLVPKRRRNAKPIVVMNFHCDWRSP
jgi:hypothetical protein